jgi:hypothetical protein
MDIDGGNLKQLTDKHDEEDPALSRDGKWVAYTSYLNKATVWKVSIDGGPPVQLTDKASENAVFSPDGKQIVCMYLPQPTSPTSWPYFRARVASPLRHFVYRPHHKPALDS